jgi:hypothetical protein
MYVKSVFHFLHKKRLVQQLNEKRKSKGKNYNNKNGRAQHIPFTP